MALRVIIKIFTLKYRRPQEIPYNKMIYFGNQAMPAAALSRYLNIHSISTMAKWLPSRSLNSSSEVCNTNKASVISRLHFKSAADAAPFYALPVSTLYQILRATLSDNKNGFCKNRLYYISTRIQCPPAVLSEKLAKRSFIYNLSFQWVESSLNVLLDKGVFGDRILRDLWVLKYHYKTIDERLQRIKDNGIVNLFPWMVRCSPDILNRYLKLTQETKSILGETNSTQMYMANRLNLSVEDVEELSTKMPALRTIRATKLKHFIDFLTKEGFNIEQIAVKPRILLSSQKTVKKRLDRLRKLGVNYINLNLLCRSNKDFERVCETLSVVESKLQEY